MQDYLLIDEDVNFIINLCCEEMKRLDLLPESPGRTHRLETCKFLVCFIASEGSVDLEHLPPLPSLGDST